MKLKSHKLPQGKSFVLKLCEFIRSSWLMEDERDISWSFYGTNFLGTNVTWINIYTILKSYVKLWHFKRINT